MSSRGAVSLNMGNQSKQRIVSFSYKLHSIVSLYYLKDFNTHFYVFLSTNLMETQPCRHDKHLPNISVHSDWLITGYLSNQSNQTSSSLAVICIINTELLIGSLNELFQKRRRRRKCPPPQRRMNFRILKLNLALDFQIVLTKSLFSLGFPAKIKISRIIFVKLSPVWIAKKNLVKQPVEFQTFACIALASSMRGGHNLSAIGVFIKDRERSRRSG